MFIAQNKFRRDFAAGKGLSLTLNAIGDQNTGLVVYNTGSNEIIRQDFEIVEAEGVASVSI